MLRTFHGVLWRSSGYVLLVASLFGWALVEARMLGTRAPTYQFLLWNLFLAWIPYVCAAAALVVRKKWLRIVLALIWLFFFPNAPYLLTDFVHFREHREFPWWFDVGMLSTFACIGLMLALTSLRLIHRQVEWAKGTTVGWFFVLGVCILSAFGVYLGRFVRLNSWELASNLDGVLRDLKAVFSDASLYPRTLGMTVLFTGIQLLCYVPFVQAERPPDRVPLP